MVVEPGEYREQLHLRNDIRVVSRVPRGATIRLPATASELEPAVVAAAVATAEFAGFRIIGDAATPLGVGLLVTDSALSIVDVEIAGATTVAIDFSAGSTGMLVGSDIRDNPGAALAIRARASPRIAHSAFTRNGTSEQLGCVSDHRARERTPVSQQCLSRLDAQCLRCGGRASPRGDDARELVCRSARDTTLVSKSLRPAAGSMMATIFHRLGPYEILREIGRGGMAVVFLASDTRTDRRVALKLVPEGTDREARDVLEAEQWGAELQQQFCLVSPHVPAVYEHGIESGYFYMAMEYLDGENLSDVITRGPLEMKRAIATAIELCRFLEDAHRFEAVIGDRNLRSLLHGDLKPRNVRITASNHVKVLDFGIAKALSLSRKVTRNDFGSVAYLSPERLESGEVDGYADYWAVGVLLYEMVSGAPPFQASDTRRLERQILSRVAPPSLADRCPIGVQAVVAKLLGPQPDRPL